MKKILLAGCVILKGNSILLLNRIKTGWYELPGGKVEKGEMPVDAAVRELKEEINCEVEIIKQLGEKDFEESGLVFNYIWFLGKIKTGKILKIREKDKFDHFRYISLKNLGKQKLSTNMKNFQSEFEAGNIRLNK